MHEIKTIDINGVTLAYREYGTGEKYLLSMQNFFFKNSHMALLGQKPYDYHVFEIYMRGYGESSHIFDTEFREYGDVWGQDLIDFAEKKSIDSFFYTGISHGNWAGWYAAFNRPEMIRAFVCVDGIVQYHEEKDLPEPLRKMRDEADSYVGNEELLRKVAWIETWPTQDPNRLKRRQENFIEHLDILMQRKKEEFALPMMNDMTGCHAKSQEELIERLHEIKFPVLIWQGGLDPISPTRAALEISQAIPGGQLMVYQHYGHGAADECPEIAARDCDRFFKDSKDRIL